MNVWRGWLRIVLLTAFDRRGVGLSLAAVAMVVVVEVSLPGCAALDKVLQLPDGAVEWLGHLLGAGIFSWGVHTTGRMAPMESLYWRAMGVGNTQAAVAKKVGAGLQQVLLGSAGWAAWVALGC